MLRRWERDLRLVIQMVESVRIIRLDTPESDAADENSSAALVDVVFRRRTGHRIRGSPLWACIHTVRTFHTFSLKNGVHKGGPFCLEKG